MSRRVKRSSYRQGAKPSNTCGSQVLVNLKIEPLEDLSKRLQTESVSEPNMYVESTNFNLSPELFGSTEEEYILELINSDETYSSEETQKQVDFELDEECTEEGGVATEAIHRKSHKLTHCSLCGKYVRNSAEHERMHLNIRVQKCPYCSKSFVHRSNFYTHLNIHTRERIYKCELCSSEFNSPHGLKQHRGTHLDSKFECLECGNLYVRKSYLRIHHQRVHEPRPRHKCLICDKQFLKIRQVEKHMDIHDNKALYGCKICRRAYKARKNLLRHLRTAHSQCSDIEEQSD